MYLVELRPGKEELYRTGDDLALAIRDGEVDDRSRIYHRATAKWISITLHPQYKAIAGQKKPLGRLVRKTWRVGPSLAGDAVNTAAASGMEKESTFQRWQRPLGLGFSCVLLVVGIQLAFSGPRPPWAKDSTPAVVWHDGSERIERETSGSAVDDDGELVALASLNEWAEAEGSEEPEAPREIEPPAVVSLPDATPAVKTSTLPRAPRLRAQSLSADLAAVDSEADDAGVEANSVQDLLRRYQMASDSAFARLESGLRVARLTRLFSPSRLMPGGGITDTRRNLAGATNIIRVFRQRQATIDRAYQDSMKVLARQYRWTPKQIRQWNTRPLRVETSSLRLASNKLITQIDSLLGVLDSHAGAYKLRGTAIAFEDPAAGQAYGALRRSIKEQIDAAISAGGGTSAGPVSLLLQAIGTSALPRET
jgi:hypothetical protein